MKKHFSERAVSVILTLAVATVFVPVFDAPVLAVENDGTNVMFPASADDVNGLTSDLILQYNPDGIFFAQTGDAIELAPDLTPQYGPDDMPHAPTDDTDAPPPDPDLPPHQGGGSSPNPGGGPPPIELPPNMTPQYGPNGMFIAPIDPITDFTGWTAISDRAGLEAITNDLSGKYYLTADIDLSGVEWVPIGADDTDPFTGTFDGQGHVISNMTIIGDVQYAGDRKSVV